MICNINQEVANQPLSPDDHIPLLQMKYSANILEDKFASFGGLDYFQPEVQQMELTGDLVHSQELVVRFKNHENPFNHVEISDVVYKDDGEQSCPGQIDFECTPGCISTTPSWRKKVIRFDKYYRVGASWCTILEPVTYGTLDERMRESLDDQTKVQGILAWNYLVCNAIAHPATTLLPSDAKCFPVHYVDAGSAAANGYQLLGQVISYMKAVFGGMTDFAILTHRYFEQDIISADSSVHAYDKTGVQTDWGTKTALIQGGWRPMAPYGGRLWGESILIAPDSIDFYGKTNDGTPVNYNPFLSDDLSKYYMVIVSRRAFYTGVVPFGSQQHYLPTCENKYESLEQWFIGYNDILFPNEIFVIAFDTDCADGIIEPTDITVSGTLTVKEGETAQINATIVPAGATNQNIIYTSANPDKAKVSSTGLVTGVAQGEAKITLVAQGNPTISKIVTVTVNAKGE